MFEAAPALGEIGAAVNISPQAVKALQAIGLADEIAAVGFTASPGHLYAQYADWRVPLNSTIATRLGQRFHARLYFTFHRADLLDALATGQARSQRPFNLGHRLMGLEEQSDRVVLAFENGARVGSRIRSLAPMACAR